jgi:hypothetical protein
VQDHIFDDVVGPAVLDLQALPGAGLVTERLIEDAGGRHVKHGHVCKPAIKKDATWHFEHPEETLIEVDDEESKDSDGPIPARLGTVAEHTGQWDMAPHRDESV